MAAQQPLFQHGAELDGSSSCTNSILSNSQDVILEGLRLDSDSPVLGLITAAGEVALEAKIDIELTGQGGPARSLCTELSYLLYAFTTCY